MNLPVMYACVRVIAETVATLPLHVFRRTADNAREREARHPVAWLLSGEPNGDMSAVSFREALTAHCLLWGNGYAEIQRDGGGRPIALWPISPTIVKPDRDEYGNLIYRVRPHNQDEVILQPWDMLHIVGLGFDGTVGHSPIHYAREAIGLGLATEEFGASFFGNGSMPGGALKYPGRLDDAGRKKLRDAWESMHGGSGNAHRAALLEEGLEWQAIGVPPEEAQFLQTRKFQIEEIARIYRVPPHIIGDLEHATFSNIEEQAIEFVVHCIRPWLVRWEAEINRKLFPLHSWLNFAEHQVDGLLRGNLAARYTAYATGVQNGWLSRNDVRRMENLNPIPGEGGDKFTAQLNLTTLDKLGEDAPEPVAPEPDPKLPDDEDVEDDTNDPAEASRELLLSLCRRIEAKEIKALAKSDKRDAFLATHSDYICTTIEPALRAIGECRGDMSLVMAVPLIVRRAADARVTALAANTAEDAASMVDSLIAMIGAEHET